MAWFFTQNTPEQETTEVQALTSADQAKYTELTGLHQRQAKLEGRMTGMSQVITERKKARTPGQLANLVKNIQIEPTEERELHQTTEERRIRALIKQE